MWILNIFNRKTDDYERPITTVRCESAEFAANLMDKLADFGARQFRCEPEEENIYVTKFWEKKK